MIKYYSIGLALVLLSVLTSTADAKRYHKKTTESSVTIALRQNVEMLKKQSASLKSMQSEMALIRQEIRPGLVRVGFSSAVPELLMPTKTAPITIPDITPGPFDGIVHVFPATGTQRGQHGDKRRTHPHAGIDIGGRLGSPIVASFSGEVISARWPSCSVKVCGPKPGGDRGYGPNIVVIKGDDGFVYRYAHLATMTVKYGQRVKAGGHIGTMGKVGAKGFPHLHFEMIEAVDYRRRPYGLHKFNPNDYLGGGRGKSMLAGVPMMGDRAKQYALARIR